MLQQAVSIVSSLLFLCVCVSAMDSLATVLTMNNANTLLSLAQQINDTRFTTGDSDGPYTILAPVDSAFSKLPPTEINSLMASPDALKEVLGVHVLRGELFSWDFVSGRILISSNGHFIRVYRRSDGTMYLNDAKVVSWDLEANGGVVILLDTVLDAPEGTIYEVLRKPDYGLSAFADLVDMTGKNRTLHRTGGPYTVFAPSQNAFNRLSEVIKKEINNNHALMNHIVEYHIHPGTLHVKSLDRNGSITTMYRGHNIGLTVDSDIHFNKVAMLEEADIDCDNGVIHIIDHVLLPSTLNAVVG